VVDLGWFDLEFFHLNHGAKTDADSTETSPAFKFSPFSGNGMLSGCCAAVMSQALRNANDQYSVACCVEKLGWLVG
jgi:hypothetical protein